MTTEVERYIAWRLWKDAKSAFMTESEFPPLSFPGDYLITSDGELVLETLQSEAVRDYQPNFVNHYIELSDGSWVLHREDGPAMLSAMPAMAGSWFDDTYCEVIGAGSYQWYLYGEHVDSFRPEQVALVLLSITDLE